MVGFVLAGCSSNLTDSTNANTESTTNKEISQVESSVENANKDQQDTQEVASSETNNSTQENPGNNGINAQIPNNLVTSLEEAVNLFKGVFPDAILTSIEIDNEKGVLVYDLDGYSTENEFGKDYWIIEGFNPEIELVLDAITGEIVARDND